MLYLLLEICTKGDGICLYTFDYCTNILYGCPWILGFILFDAGLKGYFLTRSRGGGGGCLLLKIHSLSQKIHSRSVHLL